MILGKFSKGRTSELAVVEAEKDKKEDSQMTDEHCKRYDIGVYSSIIFLCLAGVTELSLPNGIYFLSFLAIATFLATNQQLGFKFAIVLRLISVLLSVHIASIILYQFPIVQKAFDNKSLVTRLIGARQFFESSMHQLEFNSTLSFFSYMNPLILFATYLIITSTSCIIMVSI